MEFGWNLGIWMESDNLNCAASKVSIRRWSRSPWYQADNLCCGGRYVPTIDWLLQKAHSKQRRNPASCSRNRTHKKKHSLNTICCNEGAALFNKLQFDASVEARDHELVDSRRRHDGLLLARLGGIHTWSYMKTLILPSGWGWGSWTFRRTFFSYVIRCE